MFSRSGPRPRLGLRVVLVPGGPRVGLGSRPHPRPRGGGGGSSGGGGGVLAM